MVIISSTYMAQGVPVVDLSTIAYQRKFVPNKPREGAGNLSHCYHFFSEEMSILIYIIITKML